MRRFPLVAGLALVLAAAAYAGHKPNHPPNPAQTCRGLQQTDRAAFEETFGNRANAFGRCVSFTAKTRRQGQRGQGQPNPRAATNPARTCRTLRERDEEAFEEMFGARRNAFGKCVSTVAKTRGRTNP